MDLYHVGGAVPRASDVWRTTFALFEDSLVRTVAWGQRFGTVIRFRVFRVVLCCVVLGRCFRSLEFALSPVFLVLRGCR